MSTQHDNAKDFNGVLTEELRNRLRAKLKELHVPRHVIARFFGVTCSTLRKWQTSTGTICKESVYAKLLPFLEGEYDEVLRGQNAPMLFYGRDNISGTLACCLERIGRIYEICSRTPDMSAKFITRIDQAGLSALKELLGESNPEAIKSSPKTVPGKDRNARKSRDGDTRE